MKSKKRKYIWISLLLAGALSISGSAAVWANEELEGMEQEAVALTVSDDTLSENAADELEELSKEEEESLEKTDEPEASVSKEDEETVTKDTISGQKITEPEVLSENETEKKQSDSEDGGGSLSSDDLNGKEIVESENRAAMEEEEEEPLEVILPAEVPFDMITIGQKKLDGMIKSQQFCIENYSDEDVCISIQAICTGQNGKDDYEVMSSSTASDFVQGKKNIWIYLQWEDENRELLDQEKIVIGDVLNPGRGEIVLKAPKRNKEGELKGSNRQSKAYFSLAGDVKSDTGERWKNGELNLKLNMSIEAVKSSSTN